MPFPLTVVSDDERAAIMSDPTSKHAVLFTAIEQFLDICRDNGAGVTVIVEHKDCPQFLHTDGGDASPMIKDAWVAALRSLGSSVRHLHPERCFGLENA